MELDKVFCQPNTQLSSKELLKSSSTTAAKDAIARVRPSDGIQYNQLASNVCDISEKNSARGGPHLIHVLRCECIRAVLPQVGLLLTKHAICV
jgi:hypothetical protein